MAVVQAKIREIEVAQTFVARLKGWMGKVPKAGQALLIVPCTAVHTCFMKVAIDVVFLDQYGRVLCIFENMKPWRFSPRIKEAAAVMELPAGQAVRSGIREGEKLVIFTI